MPDQNPNPKSVGSAGGDEGKTPPASKLGSVGDPNPPSMRPLAEQLPERGPIEKAYKAAMLADTAGEEAKQKAKVVEESVMSHDTPSGYALRKVAGVSNDTKRGEQYLAEKTAKRWGYRYVEDDES